MASWRWGGLCERSHRESARVRCVGVHAGAIAPVRGGPRSHQRHTAMILGLPGRLEQPLDLVYLPPRLATSPSLSMTFSISIQFLLSKVPDLGSGGAEEEP